MPSEFSNLSKLSSLEADARKAAQMIEQVERGGDDPVPADSPEEPIVVEVPENPNKPPTQISAASSKTEDGVSHTRQVSTMLRVETHRRVMRAAKLQSADEKTPDSLWAILDEAAVRWCDENGY